MNERIKELSLQATDSIPDDVSAEHAMYLFQVKFAELIVQECIDIISPYAIRMENFDGGHPIADLKKHFGVES